MSTAAWNMTNEAPALIVLESHQAMPIEAQLALLYAQHCPEKLVNITPLMKLYRGRENQLLRDAIAKYCSGQLVCVAVQSVAPQCALLRKCIIEFYRHHNTAKLQNLTQIVERYEGHEQVLVRKWRRKYGNSAFLQWEGTKWQDHFEKMVPGAARKLSAEMKVGQNYTTSRRDSWSACP